MLQSYLESIVEIVQVSTVEQAVEILTGLVWAVEDDRVEEFMEETGSSTLFRILKGQYL